MMDTRNNKPSIAQAGFMLALWDLAYWCEKNNISEEDSRDLLRWFEDFHKKEMSRDLERHINNIGRTT